MLVRDSVSDTREEQSLRNPCDYHLQRLGGGGGQWIFCTCLQWTDNSNGGECTGGWGKQQYAPVKFSPTFDEIFGIWIEFGGRIFRVILAGVISESRVSKNAHYV